MSRDSHFNTGFILGAIIGGAAALLLSPQSGKKTRRGLGSKLELAGQTWRESNGDVAATLEQLFNNNTASIDKARAYFDKTIAEAKLSLADLKETDLAERIAKVKQTFENNSDDEYNDDWIDEVQAEWQAAIKTNKTRRPRKA